jgi:hypothetical protein
MPKVMHVTRSERRFTLTAKGSSSCPKAIDCWVDIVCLRCEIEKEIEYPPLLSARKIDASIERGYDGTI